MNFTKEQRTKAKAAKSAEELLTLAKESGAELTEDEAKKFYAELHREGELSNEELDAVAGGCGEGSDPDPLYKTGDHLWVGYPTSQNYVEVVVDFPEFYTKDQGWRYMVTQQINGCQTNHYLETEPYIVTYDPGSKWIFK